MSVEFLVSWTLILEIITTGGVIIAKVNLESLRKAVVNHECIYLTVPEGTEKLSPIYYRMCETSFSAGRTKEAVSRNRATSSSFFLRKPR